MNYSFLLIAFLTMLLIVMLAVWYRKAAHNGKKHRILEVIKLHKVFLIVVVVLDLGSIILFAKSMQQKKIPVDQHEIVEKIKQIPDMYQKKGCSEDEIKKAEQELGLTFPPEYIAYVHEYGCIDFFATEWTGLNIEGNCNTVTATKFERELNPNFPDNMFVLENVGIDAKIIAVDEKGMVYLVDHDTCTKICDTLSEYLERCIARKK